MKLNNYVRKTSESQKIRYEIGQELVMHLSFVTSLPFFPTEQALDVTHFGLFFICLLRISESHHAVNDILYSSVLLEMQGQLASCIYIAVM